MMKDNFSTASDQYALYRPGYPEALYDYLREIVPSFEAAWDCGTGNGQVAIRLAEFMQHVFASDISPQQLDQAARHPHIRYSVQPAEQTNFPDHSFDLITVAQAIHWFRFEAFYNEVRRTAKQGAILAVIGYGNLRVTPEVDAVISWFYHDVVGPYWDPERRYIDEEYRTIPFPFTELDVPSFDNSSEWTLDHLLGYLGTWSGVKHYRRRKEEDPIDLIREKLREAWGPGKVRKACFPMLLRVGRV